MKFESGMLGFLIIVLAVGGAIAGTILLSAEEQTEEVTKYNLVADVTGLFDTDESPQYMDYDLSKNYTGYFTEDTVIGGVNYWGGADFTSTTVNNYPVISEPSETLNDEETLSNDIAQSNPPGNSSVYIVVYGTPNYVTPAGYQQANYTNNARSVSLSTLLSTYGLEDYNTISITPSNDATTSRVLFATKGMLNDLGYGYGAAFVEKEYEQQYTPGPGLYGDTSVACLSCKINTTTRSVDLYYGTSISNSTLVNNVSLDDAIIIYEHSESTDNRRLGDTIEIEAVKLPDTQYMDINRGVTVTGVTS